MLCALACFAKALSSMGYKADAHPPFLPLAPEPTWCASSIAIDKSGEELSR